MTDAQRIIVFSPNWLGDAVMAVPAVEAIRARFPSATLAVAARAHLAALYEMVEGVDEVIALPGTGRLGGWLSASRDARTLRHARFDLAILLPNSFRSAWIARRAGIPERWGYAADGRTGLLTRAVPRVHGVHQVEYYQRLLEGVGIATKSEGHDPRTFGPSDLRTSVHLTVPAGARDWARQTLATRLRSGASRSEPGRDDEPLVGMAPGAAYGGAKQWPPERFAQLAVELGGHPSSALGAGGAPPPRAPRNGVRTVLVGSAGDRAVCDAIAASAPGTINLCGETDLRQLAAIVAECRTFVSNDSGAMHLAAAVGVPVVAIFGSTNEKETAPLPVWTGSASPVTDAARSHAIVATDLECRPCMRRECPLEGHPCMTGIDVERVRGEVIKRL